MEENNGDGGSGVSSTETPSKEGTFQTLVARYNSLQEPVAAVSPRIIRVIELVLAIVLLVGTAYWAYAYFVIGA